MTFYDTNAWLGSWPFNGVAGYDAAGLADHWRRHGIAGGLVSSFDGLWVADPMPANRALRKVVKRRGGMVPLPVLNPVAPGWEEHLAELMTWPEVKAVRLAPAYGGWTLASRTGRAVRAALAASEVRTVLTVRLVDERQDHAALNVKPLAAKAVGAWLSGSPGLPVLVQGLTRAEVDTLAKAADGFWADLTFAEWADTLAVIGRVVPHRRMVFGSLTPLHITTAQTQKVSASPAPAAVRRSVAAGNARRFLDL